MKLLYHIEKYQNAIFGTLLVHVLIFVWMNIQDVSYYRIDPKEKTIAIIEFTEEKEENINVSLTELSEQPTDKIELTNISSNYDPNKTLDPVQKKQLEKSVIDELNNFEQEEFNKLNKDNPELIKHTESGTDSPDDNSIRNKSIEKNATAIAKYFLRDRQMTSQQIPSYICNEYGVVRLDVKVNQKGKVIDTKINTEFTTTNNDCLLRNAIDYSKKWRFNSDFQQPQRVSGWIEFVYLSQ